MQPNTEPVPSMPFCPVNPPNQRPEIQEQHDIYTAWWDDRMRGGPWISNGKLYVVTPRPAPDFITILKRNGFNWDKRHQLWHRPAGFRPELALQRTREYYQQYYPWAHDFYRHEGQRPCK